MGPRSIGPYELVSSATLEEHGLTCEGDPVFRVGSTSVTFYANAKGFEALHKFDGTPCDRISAVVLKHDGSDDVLTPGIIDVLHAMEQGEYETEPSCRSTSYIVACSNFYDFGWQYLSAKMARTGHAVEFDAAELRAFYDAFVIGYGFGEE